MLIETVNLHVWPKCDLHCLYCYETFPDRPKSLPLAAWRAVLDEIARERVVRVTFSGGEPTLHPDLVPMLEHAKAVGLQTSIVTDGARLSDEHIALLDVVGMTLDSDDPGVLRALGRVDVAGHVDYRARFRDVARRVRAGGGRLKVNTVVTALNADADLRSALREARPFKWKPMQFTRIAGENDAHADRLAVGTDVFDAFIARHRTALEGAGIWVAAESEQTVRSSYAMIDPTGRAFQTTDGSKVFSEPVTEVGLRRALEQVGGYDRERFLARGGHVDVRRLPVRRN